MKKILLTGPYSMIGRSLTPILQDAGFNILLCSHKICDLTNSQDTYNIFESFGPDYVIHLATYSGNIQFNQKYPADTFHNTSMMALNVLRASQKCKVQKVLSIISSCAIGEKDSELLEWDLHEGPPNPSIESHGYAKRILDIYSRQLAKQYELNAVTAIVNNSFGQYDSFSPEKTKVIGAFIKKYVDAKEQNLPFVENWGTGKALREFIYCKDVAQLLLRVLYKYNDTTLPINIGHPDEISIKELAEKISKLVGYSGETRWLPEKGDGQLRKKLYIRRMEREILDDKQFDYTPFDLALSETIEWYLKNRKEWKK